MAGESGEAERDDLVGVPQAAVDDEPRDAALLRGEGGHAPQVETCSPYYRTWLERPLHCTGVGKALLLGMSSEQRRRVLGNEPYSALTPHTITTFADIEKDMALARQRGYVVSAEEHQIGLTAISAPIVNWSSVPIGCLTVTDHAARLKAREAEMAKELVSAAQLVPYQTTSLLSVDQFFGR